MIDDGAGARQRINRNFAGQEMIKGRGERVEIATRVRACALNLFKRRVVARVAIDARGQARVGLRRRAFGQTEVEQNDLPARRELQVLRLDVAVYDRRLV